MLDKLLRVDYLNKADKIIKDLGHNFSWKEFDSLYYNRQNSKSNNLPSSESLNIIKQVQEYAKILDNEGRLSSAESYEITAKHLKAFVGVKNQILFFSSVTGKLPVQVSFANAIANAKVAR